MHIYAYVFIAFFSSVPPSIPFSDIFVKKEDLVLHMYCSKSRPVIVCSKQEDVGGSGKRKGQRKGAKSEKMKVFARYASMRILMKEANRWLIEVCLHFNCVTYLILRITMNR